MGHLSVVLKHSSSPAAMGNRYPIVGKTLTIPARYDMRCHCKRSDTQSKVQRQILVQPGSVP